MRPPLITYLLLLLVVGCGGSGGGGSASSPIVGQLPAGDQDRQLQIGPLVRSYRLHIPAGIPADQEVPVIVVLHGRYGTGVGAQNLYGFNAVGDPLGVVTVFPNGIDQSWNDGRGSTPAALQGVDDLAFMDAIHADLETLMRIDERRYAVCGMSNGAVMSHRLAAERSALFTGVAAVCGLVAEAVAMDGPLGHPLHLVQFSGTADAASPYAGGDGGSGGVVRGAEQTAAWYGAADAAAVTALPDTAADGCTVERLAWTTAGSATIHLYRITDGGHAWPGRPGPVDLGNTCLDIDATQLAVEFLLSHPRPVPDGDG